MGKHELGYFVLLKKTLETKFKNENPGCLLEISKWRQKEINRFQQMMEEEVNGRVSEKWFYTHLKPENNKKLPRIDTLNLLCRFVGFKDWDDFVSNNLKNYRAAKPKLNKTKFKKGALISLASIAIVLVVVLFANTSLLAQSKYSFCFVNSDSGDRLHNAEIEVVILHEEQSSELINCGKSACFEYETGATQLKFAVKAPYYKTDTIIRKLNKNKKEETIELKPDDYAWMIHIFSSSKMEDWQKRRNQLDGMIAGDAKIYQIDAVANRGIEIYNKQEFINKMTMPINSLKNLKIIETIYHSGRIAEMRFVQQIENE